MSRFLEAIVEALVPSAYRYQRRLMGVGPHLPTKQAPLQRVFLSPSLLKKRGQFSRGFTLLEVVISIAILSLIVGGVMASVSVCLQSTEIMRWDRVHQTQCDALQALLQRDLLTLPSDAVLRYVPGDARGGQPAPLRMRARKPALIFTSLPWLPGRTCESVISFRRQADGSLSLGAGMAKNETATFLPADTFNSRSFAWTPLLRGIRDAEMRFYDADQGEWTTSWDKDDARPSLVELRLEFVDAALPFRGIFWIPARQVDTASGRGALPASS